MREHTYGAILATVKTLISSFTNLMYVPLLLYFIGTQEFGIYQLAGSFIAYINNADFGHCATTRMYTVARLQSDDAQKGQIVGFSILFYALISALIVFAGIFIYPHLDVIFHNSVSLYELDVLKNLFILMLVNVVISFTSSVFTSIINSYEKFIFLRTLQIIQSLIRPIAIVACLFFFPYAVTVAVVQTVFAVFYAIIRAWYCFTRLHMPILLTNFSRLPIKSFLILASSTLVVFFMEQLLWRANQIILGISHGTKEVAVYAVASVLYLAYASFALAIPSVFFSKITTIVTKNNDKKAISDAFIHIARVQWMFLFLILLGFIFVGKEFIVLWAGHEFSDAYTITLIIMVPFAIELTQSAAFSIMQAQNTYAYRVKVYGVMGIMNVILAVPLAHFWGGIGCAVALGLTMFVGNGLIMNLYFWKHMHLDLLLLAREVGQIFLASVPVFFIATYCNHVWADYSLLTLASKIVIITFSYVLCQCAYIVLCVTKKNRCVPFRHDL